MPPKDQAHTQMQQIDELLNISLNNLPSIEAQRAIADEIEQLKAQGLSEAQVLLLVFNHNPFGTKSH